jgi:hypothetical protein
LPVCGSTSSRPAVTIAPEKSVATVRPTSVDLFTLFRTTLRSSSVPWKVAGITLPPEKPSSITSMKRVLGVKSDFTEGRSTPFSRKTSLVSAFSFCMNSLL